MERYTIDQTCDFCSMSRDPEGEYVEFEEVAKLTAKLAEVNRIIFAAGAPLGSENYFAIRVIVAPFGR